MARHDHGYLIDPSIPGWTYNKELYWLAMLASRVPPSMEIVEIGAWCGRSTYPLFHNRQDGTRITVVDTFACEGTYGPDVTSLVTALGDRDRINRMIELARSSGSWLPCFRESVGYHDDLTVVQSSSLAMDTRPDVGLVFIDGNHEDGMPTVDLEKFLDDPHTLIAMDDCVSWWPDVVSAVIMARSRYKRSVIMPMATKMALILPTTGPMLDAASEIMASTMANGSPFDPRPVDGYPWDQQGRLTI